MGVNDSWKGANTLGNCTILPEQFFPVQSHKFTPEMRLLVAILEDALHIFQRCAHARTRRERRLWEEVRDWFWDKEESIWLCNFENICGILGLEPGYLRCGLTAWLEKAKQDPQLKIPLRQRVNRCGSHRVSDE